MCWGRWDAQKAVGMGSNGEKRHSPNDLDQATTGLGTPLAMHSSFTEPPTETLNSLGLRIHFGGICARKKNISILFSNIITLPLSIQKAKKNNIYV